MSAAAASSESYAAGLGRAFGGAIFFALPLMMTMEMWALGFHMDRVRLAIFLILAAPLLFGLAYYAGFRSSQGWRGDLLDTGSAYAVGFLVSAAMLMLFGVVDFTASPDAVVGQIAVQAVPAAIGAVVARKQLGGAGAGDSGQDDHDATYGGELFLMAAGALFVAFNVAPTEEIILIAYQMTLIETLALVAVSLALLHVLVFKVGFAGQEDHDSARGAFFRFTLPGYGLALLVSVYVLWTFGRTEGEALVEIVSAAIVLGFPAALGAALARLVV